MDPEDSSKEQEIGSTVPELPPRKEIRRDWYQTDASVFVNFMVKNLKKEEVLVEFSSKSVSFSAKLPDGTNYEAKLNLFSEINPNKSQFKVLSSKVEIILGKVDATPWSFLEAVELKSEIKPTYPTSSKKKLDWGKVEKDIEKEIPEDEDINNLFSKIFNSGDEDTKKAMMKSMQESGGTVLSTNWSEVGKKPVECSPPDGMEWKKWDS